MMNEIKDKVVLVTGGAAGIGAGIVRAFLEEGAKHVAILDINTINGTKLEAELSLKYGREKVKFYKCDVTTSDLSDAYNGVVNQFGYIDVVVNGAGILNDSYDAYVKCIQVNVTALITSSFKAYELMRKDRGGRGGTIINISSHGAFSYAPMLPVYCATKAAVLKFSNSLGMESTFTRTGVRVIAMCFGMTDTGMVALTGTETFDSEMGDMMLEVAQTPKMTVSTAVFGVIEAYKRGLSSSTWSVGDGKAPFDITEDVSEGMKICSRSLNLPDLCLK